jgi:hypothetical protein
LIEFLRPSVDDRVLIEVRHGSHDAILEFLFGGDSDVAQNGAGELGKEALDEIEPGAVLRASSSSARTLLTQNQPTESTFYEPHKLPGVLSPEAVLRRLEPAPDHFAVGGDRRDRRHAGGVVDRIPGPKTYSGTLRRTTGP